MADGDRGAVSIVVPLHDAEPWIGETLASVLGQPWQGLIRDVIVVNDGSSDAGPRLAEETLAGSGCQYSVLHGPCRGPSVARNTGLAVSKGRFVLFLDADDVILPGSIVRMLAAIERDGADVAYCLWDRLVETATGWCREAGPRRALDELNARPDVASLLGFWAPPVAILYSRSIVDRIGGFRESLPVIQDARFFQDAGRLGARCIRIPEVGALYRVHRGASVSRRDPRGFTRDIVRNAAELMDLWQGAGELDLDRRSALLEVLGSAARGSVRVDDVTFHEAARRLDVLNPEWVPKAPRALRVASRLLGFRRAMRLADATYVLRHRRP